MSTKAHDVAGNGKVAHDTPTTRLTMQIILNSDHRITSDAYQWALQARRASIAGPDNKTHAEGEEIVRWEGLSYHSTLGAAAKAYGERRLRESDLTVRDVESLAQAHALLDDIAAEIERAFGVRVPR